MRALLILLLFCFAPLAAAQDSSDAALQSKLNAIYGSTSEMADIEVGVENGVVTLSGTLATSERAKDAISIAQSQDGTVYVQDRIDRVLVGDTDVSTAVDGLKQDAADITRSLPIIGLAIAILLLFGWLGGLISRRKVFWTKIAPNPFLGELLSQTARVLFIVAGAVIALNLLGAQAMIATILGGAGVAGIAIGFAVRDTLENYFASIMLSLRQPFRAGDHVRIEAHEGKVMRLTSRATILMTLDGNHLRIPNSTVFKSVILNYTTNPERRFQFDLGVDAADDPVAAMHTGLAVMSANEFVLKTPKPTAVITDVGDSNIVIRFQGWVDQTSTDFGKARSLSIRAVKGALEEQGFSLPEPIYRVKLDNMAGTKLDLAAGPVPAKPKLVTLTAQDMDVTPDTTIDDKVDEELASTGEPNLLDDDKPVE